MGRPGRRILDFARAGALAAGTAFLLGLWFQGMAELGFRGHYPNGFSDFLIVAIAGVAAGATLGFPAPAAGALAVLGRIAGTTATGIAIAAPLGLFTALLGKWLDAGQDGLTIYFLLVGLSLVAVGLRRAPRTVAARLAVGVPIALLVASRLLAHWPEGAHALTRRLFPLRPAAARAELERAGWGPLGLDGRTRIVAFEAAPRYRTESSRLASDVTMKLTLEVAKPFFQDGCGELYGSRPTVPAWVRVYSTQEACLKEHPHRRDVQYDRYFRRPSPCCLFEVRQRQPGERIAATRIWLFQFSKLAWRAAR